MNRFDNGSVSAYNPMSMQEIMMVPLAMREQHNNVQKDIQAQQSELDKINALPVHTEEAKQRKDYLLSRIDALSSDLANKGFDNGMTDNVIKLNREVKDEFSPTGRLGQINNAHSTYFKALEDFKKSNEDKKWSQQEFDLNWNKHLNQYKGYNEKGEITSIDSLSAPEKRTIQDEWEQISKITGNSKIATDILKGTSYIVPGPNGSVMTINKKTGDKISYNNPQIVAGLSSIYAKLNDPTSDLSIAREYAGRSLESDMFEAYNLGLSKIDTDIKTIRDTEKSLSGVKNSYDLAAEQEANTITMANTEEASADPSESIGQSQAIVNTLDKKGFTNLTDDEKEQYIVAKGMLDSYNKIDKNKIHQYSNIVKSNGKLAHVHYANELGISGSKGITLSQVERIYNNSKDKFLSKYKKGTEEYKFAKELATGEKSNLKLHPFDKNTDTKLSVFEKIQNDYDKNVYRKEKIYHAYRNDVFSNQNKYTQYYTPLTSDSEKGTGKMISVINDKLSQVVQNPTSANAFSSITQVSDSEGNMHDLRKGDMKKNITQNRTNIHKVMQTADKLEFVDMSDNDNGYPSMRFRVYPGKDNDANEKILGGIWKKGTVGEGKPFTVTVRLGDKTNITSGASDGYGTNSPEVELLKLIRDKGGLKGQAIAQNALNKIEQNR
jgi:hypothetical protein